MLFSIDTATNTAGLALFDERQNQCIAAYEWEIGQQHSVQIFGAMEHFLQQAGCTLNDISAICVVAGPGSFNGLRVGVTVAKTLAFLLSVPLLGIISLDAMVPWFDSEKSGETSVLSVMDAGRNELYYIYTNARDKAGLNSAATQYAPLYQRFGPSGRSGVATDAPEIIAAAAKAYDAIYVYGQIADLQKDILRRALTEQQIQAEFCAPINRAAGAAALAARTLAGEYSDETFTLEPVYVRPANITVSVKHPLPEQA